MQATSCVWCSKSDFVFKHNTAFVKDGGTDIACVRISVTTKLQANMCGTVLPSELLNFDWTPKRSFKKVIISPVG